MSVENFEWRDVRVVARREQVAADDDRLRRSWLVDHINDRLLRLFAGRDDDLGVSPGFQAAKAFSSSGVISLSVVSPVTTSVALFGLNQTRW